MSDAIATGLIGLGGVALGIFGNAAIEWVRRTASRRDAARERQVEVLRELQDVLEEFNREWSALISDIAQGKITLGTIAFDSKPSLVLSRYRVLTRRVMNDNVRKDLESISALAFQFAASQQMGDISGMVSKAQDRLGEALRSES